MKTPAADYFFPTTEAKIALASLQQLGKVLVECRWFKDQAARDACTTPLVIRDQVLDFVADTQTTYLNGSFLTVPPRFGPDYWPLIANETNPAYTKYILQMARAKGAAGLYFGFRKNFMRDLDGLRMIRKRDVLYGCEGETLYFMPVAKHTFTSRTNRTSHEQRSNG